VLSTALTDEHDDDESEIGGPTHGVPAGMQRVNSVSRLSPLAGGKMSPSSAMPIARAASRQGLTRSGSFGSSPQLRAQSRSSMPGDR
jgi:hypothetical protein